MLNKNRNIELVKLESGNVDAGSHHQTALIVREGEFFLLREISFGMLTSAVEDNARELLERVGGKFQKDLGLRVNPITTRRIEGDLKVRISHMTGSLFLSGCQIEIIPKFISAANEKYWSDILLEVLARARHKRYGYVKNKGFISSGLSFIDHVALAYADSLDQALEQENIRTYKNTEEELPFLRGRLLIQKSIMNAFSRPHRYVCEVDYLEENNEYNNLLSWALSRFQSCVFDAKIKQRLMSLEYRLPGYGEQHGLPSRLPLIPPAQYRHFEESLEIASNLAMGNQYSIDGGSSSTYGYILNTEVLYEKFIEETLKFAVRLLGGEYYVSPQDSKLYAEAITDKDRSYYTRPDNVIYHGESPMLLIDAKYKKFTDSETGNSKRPQNSDVYQLVASLVSYGCRVGILLYPGMGVSTDVGGKSPFHMWKVGSADSLRVVIGVSIDMSCMRDRNEIIHLDRKLSKLVVLLLENTLSVERLALLQSEMDELWSE